jgi:hypothetical protein
MEQAGVALIAQGAGAYLSDLKSATGATNTFVDTADKGSGTVGRAGDMMGSAIKGVASIAAGAGVAGFLALGKAIFDGLGDARESARLNAATEQTITSMGNAAGVSAQHVSDMAANLSDAAGMSLFGDDQIQQSENLLLTFGNIKGETFDLATALTTDLAQALGGAPADQAMMLGKALNDPIHGMSALGKAGLTFSEEQKAAITAMQESGDMAGAQAIIIKELNAQVGGQAKAAAEAAGGMVQFKARLGETFETVANQLLPILNDFGDWLNSPEVTQGIETIAGALGDGFGWLHDNIPPTIDLVLGVFDDLQGSLESNAGFFESTFTSVKNIVTDAGKIIQIVLGATSSFISDHGETIQRILGNTWESIKSVIDIALALIEGVVKTTLALLQGDWQGAWTAITDMSARIVTDLGTIISGGLDNLLALFQDLTGNVQTSWDVMIDDALTAGSELVAGIQQGVRDSWDGFVDWIIDLATGLIDEFLKAWGIKSPATEWMPAGEFAVEGIMAGFSNMWPQLTDLVSGLSDDLISQVADIGSDIQGIIADSFGATASIDRQIAANLGKFKDVLPDYQQYVTGALKQVQQEAEAFLDPAEGAKFFKQRSDQIFEYEKLRKDLSDEQQAIVDASADQMEEMAKSDQLRAQLAIATTDAEREAILKKLEASQQAQDAAIAARHEAQAMIPILQQQMALIAAAQRAEVNQSNATPRSNPMQEIIDQISKLFNNPKIADLEEQYAKAKTDAEREKIKRELDALRIPVNDTGPGHDLMMMMNQLMQMFGIVPRLAQGGIAQAGQPHWVGEDGPELFFPGITGMVSPAASSQQMAARANTTNYYGNVGPQVSMPIYTNNSPAAIQQSWAIMQASMP